MAKVTITVEGEPHEIRRTLRRLLKGGGPRRGCCGPHRHDHHHEEEAGAMRQGPGRHHGGHRREMMAERARRRGEMMAEMAQAWSAEELAQLWGEITEGARAVLKEIASRPEGYPSGDLQQALGMPGNAIGGTLSSVGGVSRRFGPKPPVYFFRWDTYRMFPTVAEVFTRLAAEQKPDTEAK